MFRFLIILLLINTSYHSLGVPVSPHLLIHPLAQSLKALAERCDNEFIVSQIKGYIPECNINYALSNGKQMQCLIFYDMNSQLCDAVGNSKLVQQNDLSNQLLKIVKVNSMCESAQNWKFTNLVEFPQYKNTAEIVFKNQVQCQKVCDVFDLASEDSNIFCKYYKWGSEILNIPSSTLQAVPAGEDKLAQSKIVASAPERPISTDANPIDNLSNNLSGIPSAKNNVEKADNTVLMNPNKHLIDTTITNVEKPEEEQGDKAIQATSFNTAMSDAETNQDPKKETIQKASEQPTPIEISNNVEQLAVAQKPDIPVRTEIEKTMPDEEEQPPKKVDIEKENQMLNNQNKEIKDTIVEDLGEDPDSEEDEKQVLQDDSEISIGKGDIQKIEEKIKENIENNIPLRTTYTAEKSQEEFMSKTPQEDFPEDDDHFFSFFLTAVIIVVLLYILYHNKSKFTKVILGLIVEGRQPGRRRNSRGHSYRRLDTLEQAMSSNNPAPPSKIIY